MEKLSRIEINYDEEGNFYDCSFFFADATNPNEPFVVHEFKKGSDTRKILEELEDSVIQCLDTLHYYS